VLNIIYYGDQLRKHEMGRICDTWVDIYNISVGESEGKRSLKRGSVDGRITLKWLLKK
jgi:hypothetical protein